MLDAKIKVGGRLRLLRDRSGAVVLHIDTLTPINQQWANVPTFIMDATLPGIEILKQLYAKVRIVGDLNIAASHAKVRQVINAPVSAKRLKSERNRHALLRYILKRWLDCKRGKTLVVAQGHKPPKPDEDYEAWLKKLAGEAGYADWLLKPGRLPDNIHVEHFNAIAGDDRYKDVALEIVIGRTEPTPLAMETEAGMISGTAPETIIGPGNWWYPSKDYEIAPGVIINCSYHPEALVQAVYEQACPAGVIQAGGRARSVLRTAADPVEIDYLADVFLPIKLDIAEKWQAPGAVLWMAYSGVVVDSPSDMVAVWPDIWPNERAAQRTLAAGGFKGHFSIEGFPLSYYRKVSLKSDGDSPARWQAFRYQHAGERGRRGQPWRRGWYDRLSCLIPRYGSKAS